MTSVKEAHIPTHPGPSRQLRQAMRHPIRASLLPLGKLKEPRPTCQANCWGRRVAAAPPVATTRCACQVGRGKHREGAGRYKHMSVAKPSSNAH